MMFKQDQLQMKQLETFAENHNYKLSTITKNLTFIKEQSNTRKNMKTIFKSYKYLKYNNFTYVDNMSKYM